MASGTPKTRLELTRIGKDIRPRLEPRILLVDASKSYHAPRRITENERFDNRLICGDNPLALKALKAEFAGRIKCLYIDPPYNTGSAFTHYDDGIEHSPWLSLMRDRLEILRLRVACESPPCYTAGNTRAVPLARKGDAHQGRVFSCATNVALPEERL